MDTLKCIKTRRSIRKFLKEEISDDIILKILDAGIAAPSSMDSQPWHFVVVRDQEMKEKLVEKKEKANQDHAKSAPVVIIVCVDKEKSSTRYIEDAVTATQNILLAVNYLDMGAVYVTAYNEKHPEYAEEVQKLLGLPENIIPVTMLPMGYPDPEEELMEKRFVEHGDVVHWEEW